MMKSLKILFITAGLVLTSCSKTEPIQWMGDLKQLVSLNDEITGAMRVTDLDGKPISEAQILIGQALNEPFAANFIKADANGNFVAPAAWKTAQTVTLSAPGYLRASFVGQPCGQGGWA